MTYDDIPKTEGNSNMGSSHERIIRKILESEGFVRYRLPGSKEGPILEGFTKEDIHNQKRTSNIPGPIYLKNPLGGSKHPDFVLFYQGWVFYIEAKSIKSSYNAMWGSSFPEGDAIWVVTCGCRKVNETTFFLGSDLIPPELARWMKQFQKEELERQKKQHQRWKDITGNIGLDLRPMKFSDCSKKLDGVFFHPDRKIRETKVLAYLSYSEKWPVDRLQRIW
jgi:hypothetical protein